MDHVEELRQAIVNGDHDRASSHIGGVWREREGLRYEIQKLRYEVADLRAERDRLREALEQAERDVPRVVRESGLERVTLRRIRAALHPSQPKEKGT